MQPGLKMYLSGELGAGKTTLVRGMLAALGFAGRVKSPSYSLVELYVVSGLNLYHFDFYRFKKAIEFRDAGFGDYFDDRNVCIVEWPKKAQGELPAADLNITLEIDGAGARVATLKPGTESGQRCIETLKRHL